MTATRGPVPKHSSQRRRRNKTGVESIEAGAPASQPAVREGLHPLAAHWYESLGQSAQSRFYEASDWAAALIVAEAIDAYARKPTGSLLGSILSGFQVLLVTEGDRRRMRMELERSGDANGSPQVGGKVIDYRSRLA